jgi:PIN domain nuclease of toxin-antitoxin system
VASLTHLDTHVAGWLYASRRDLLSRAARERIDTDSLAISPMAVLELTYLHEIGRTNEDGPTVLTGLRNEIGLEVDATPFAEVVAHAHGCTWTRDPFDRIIAAQALVAGATLLTRDTTVRKHVARAVW